MEFHKDGIKKQAKKLHHLVVHYLSNAKENVSDRLNSPLVIVSGGEKEICEELGLDEKSVPEIRKVLDDLARGEFKINESFCNLIQINRQEYKEHGVIRLKIFVSHELDEWDYPEDLCFSCKRGGDD